MDKRLAYLGVIAPIGFTVAVIVLGALTPSYSHVYHTISELGEIGAPYGREASLVFIATGLMLVGFGYYLHWLVKKEDRLISSGSLLMVYAIADFIGSGVFPVDPGGSVSTDTAAIHVTVTVVGELAALLMPFIFLLETENHTGWDRLRTFSRITSVASIPAAAYLVYNIERNIPGVPNTPIGLAQRIMVGILLTWVTGTAIGVRNSY